MIIKLLKLLAIILSAMWVGFDPDWESVLTLLGFLTTFTIIEVKSSNKQINVSDIKLFHEFIKLLPSNSPTMQLLSNHDFKAPFQWENLASLEQYNLHWNNAEHNFVDKQLEKARNELYKLVSSFLPYLAGNVWHSDIPNWIFYRVPSEWGHKQHDRYVEVTGKLNKMASDIFIAHQSLIKIGIKKNLLRNDISYTFNRADENQSTSDNMK
jgi:hypothetical protein